MVLERDGREGPGDSGLLVGLLSRCPGWAPDGRGKLNCE